MAARKIVEGVYWVGAVDWDRRIFDEVIPLPDGTSYNSYLVKGSEKIALIDTVDPTKTNELIGNLKEVGVKKIDYIIANHAEQDHSGSIPEMLKRHPEAKVVTNEKCRGMLIDLLHVPAEKFIVVENHGTLSLGDKTLEFILAPWVHWPETMFTYIKEDKILFTCDLFGSHLATSDLYAKDESKVLEAAKLYYATIMMPFKTLIRNHIKTIDSIDVQIIAPSHGPLYDKPQFILNAHREWASDKVENAVVIPYVSMHASTHAMVCHLSDALTKRGVKVYQFNLMKTDAGKLAVASMDAATIVIATPTFLGGPHPTVAYAAMLLNALKPKTKYVAVINSYGWASKTPEQIAALTPAINAENIGAVSVKGHPTEKDYAALDALSDTIARKHREAEIVN
ncbi:Type A flavoprotein FprA [uncultured archaeon]|nr:Type A flavoprotein FprA [uncultured archaeon]